MNFPAQSLETLKKNTIRFFDQYIIPYVVGDLKVLEKIEPDVDGLGACAVPTAMAVMSTIDLLGFLLSPNGETDSSKNNIQYYLTLENLDGVRIFPTYYDNRAIDKLFNYRHGMMHHFFPKFRGKFAGIFKDPSQSKLFIQHPEIGDPDAKSLNVHVFQNDFQQSVYLVKRMLEVSTDYDTFSRFVKRLKDFEFNLELVLAPTTTQPPGTPQNRY